MALTIIQTSQSGTKYPQFRRQKVLTIIVLAGVTISPLANSHYNDKEGPSPSDNRGLPWWR